MKDQHATEISEIDISEDIRVGLIQSMYHSDITGSLKSGALEVFQSQGISNNQVTMKQVPGTFELPQAASILLSKDSSISGLVCFGAVITGETDHAHYINDSVSTGIQEVSIKYEKPVMFGVLTCDTVEQALDRSNQSRRGNKGAEAAVALLKMIDEFSLKPDQ